MNTPTDQHRKNLSSPPSLSVCMIVRDEEQDLPRCLHSVQPVADEVIVVDTGSKDQTVAVAVEHGARVFHFDWCHDFSAARNESLKHASGDWILQMDADEALLSDAIPHLRDIMQEPDLLACAVLCDSGPEYQGPRFCWVLRLFRNHPALRYSRPYHESVEESLFELMAEEQQWEMRKERTITIRHYGYEPSSLPEKRRRGVSIMKSYVREHPEDWHTLTMLGSACGGLGDYDEAETYLTRALEIQPDNPVAHYSLGLALQKKKKLDEAIACFEKALGAEFLRAEAHTGLGVIYLEKGRVEMAMEQLEKALAINPDLASAQSLLTRAKALSGRQRFGSNG